MHKLDVVNASYLLGGSLLLGSSLLLLGGGLLRIYKWKIFELM